jgi:hypothetical protein
MRAVRKMRNAAKPLRLSTGLSAHSTIELHSCAASASGSKRVNWLVIERCKPERRPLFTPHEPSFR